MHILVSIDKAISDPREVALLARGYLSGVVAANRLLIRRKLVPPIYQSGVRFSPEPWAGKRCAILCRGHGMKVPGLDEFADCVTTFKRGEGDCDDLVAWRVAELQEQGVDASIKIYWRSAKRRNGRKLRVFHAECRLPDGSVEDVARFLGM